MDSGSQILHMILFISILILILNSQLLIAGASLSAAENSDDHGIQELFWVEDSRDENKNQIKKVSGNDENEETKAFILEKFRVLIGLKSFNIKSPNGCPSPSPAPANEAETPAPAPVVPIHLHSHPPSPRSSPKPPPYQVERRNGDNAKVRRIVIAVVVSTGVTFVLSALGLILVCKNFGRRLRRRSMKTMMVCGANGGSRGRSKYVNSPNSVRKVSFDPGPDLFYLNSLGLVSESSAASCLKQTCETVNISLNQNTLSTPLDKSGESCRDSIKSESDNVSCCSAEENLSVHEGPEPMKCASANEIPLRESLSSDDESFHSLCDSHSSNVRLSNASDGNLSDQSEICSPLSPSRRSPPSSSSFRAPTLSSLTESLAPPVTSGLTPPLHSNIQSSSSSPYNSTDSTPKTSYSSNFRQGFSHRPSPPPPPPPPPPQTHVHFSPSQSSSCSTRIRSTASYSPTILNVVSPRNSNSSSGSNQTPPNDFPSSSLCKPLQTSPILFNGAGSIPPPPCPPLPPLLSPQFVKGRSNSIQPPPPPPSQLGQFIPVGKDGAPLPKLKPLHWDKVRAAPDRSMVWDKLRSSSFELNEEMIESLFGYNLQRSIKNDEAKSKSPSPSKHVLEPKRLQNITILSKGLNATAEQICNALMQGGGLCLQQLEALVKMVPTKEEEAKLSSYQEDINELGSAEKVVKAMLNIPFAFQRIEAMLYRDTFEDEVVHLRKSFAMLEEACKELRSSFLFLKLLEAVLKTGNRMNVGTIRGGARAFKLDTLLKLADVKGTDGKTTLLHFVVQEIIRSERIRDSEIIIKKSKQTTKNMTIEEKEEYYRRRGLDLVSGLSAELSNVKKTATIDLDVLASSVSNLSDGMFKLQQLVRKDLPMDNQNGNFVYSMRSFLNYAEKNIKQLQEDENRVILHVREITEYFHGDVSKDEVNPLRIFVIVRDFLGMLDQVCKEVRTLKIPSVPNPLAPFQ